MHGSDRQPYRDVPADATTCAYCGEYASRTRCARGALGDWCGCPLTSLDDTVLVDDGADDDLVGPQIVMFVLWCALGALLLIAAACSPGASPLGLAVATTWFVISIAVTAPLFKTSRRVQARRRDANRMNGRGSRW